MLNLIKSLLRPPEQKASRTARLIALESGGRARWRPWSGGDVFYLPQ